MGKQQIFIEGVIAQFSLKHEHHDHKVHPKKKKKRFSIAEIPLI